MTEMTDTTYRTTVTVQAPIERAFKVFTDGFDTWWPRSHHIGTPEMAEAVLEPRLGGRWFERGVDGSECDWGQVLAWEPPAHVAVSWQIDGEFKKDDDTSHASRVDVWFTAADENTTVVELAHSGLDRHGETWQQLRTGISNAEGGWPDIIRRFVDAVA
jgi:uncharacterized protein YndB with AHSA1/START domain